MRNLFKKLAYLFLTLVIANVSLQAVYATSFYLDQIEIAEQGSNKHCVSQKAKQTCACENCNCDMCITLQANIQTALQMLLDVSLTVDIATKTIPAQYTQHYHNPLLRPPIT